ncbi:hypothetical protein LIER_25025 [Lithospermum erythrorhizon]|uniref:Uncharacterized protein n=1 Tax=Lithospermum erythrorhizon TaxID=34254 RepID=A0AAV3R692_LITER
MSGYSANYLDQPYTLPDDLEVTDKSKLWKALDAFRATRPLLLEEIGKTYEDYIDPLEIQGTIAKHLSKVSDRLSRVDGILCQLSAIVFPHNLILLII